MKSQSMKHNMVSASRFWVLGIALLILVGCTHSVGVGERFTLWEGETVTVRDTGLTIEAEMVGIGIPGSQRSGDGFADLRVMVRGEEDREVFLEVGEKARVGGYEIHLESMVSDVDREGCELVVTR